MTADFEDDSFPRPDPRGRLVPPARRPPTAIGTAALPPEPDRSKPAATRRRRPLAFLLVGSLARLANLEVRLLVQYGVDLVRSIQTGQLHDPLASLKGRRAD